MNKSNVLLIYTGGTIGMIEDAKRGVLVPFGIESIKKHIPELAQINTKVEAVSLETPIDSSDMNPTVWKEIAQQVVDNYEKYDGFVILHGSDTMAYTASALSFMLQGLKKPVILTGSQLPIGMIRTDGKENLVTSIEIASSKDENGDAIIQEVAVYFEDFLFRGNRTTKVSANAFEAFSSPNYLNLAFAGIKIRYHSAAFYKTTLTQLNYLPAMSDKVALIKLFPGCSASIYTNLFNRADVDAVVIESFGAGNPPNNDELFKSIEQFINKGGVVLNITQCSSGSVVHGKYANSTILNSLGVISGNDLTTEAAIAKVMHVLGNYSDLHTIKERLVSNIVGEIEE